MCLCVLLLVKFFPSISLSVSRKTIQNMCKSYVVCDGCNLQIQFVCVLGRRAMGKSSFFKVWQQHMPFIVVGKPMTDLCWICKQNNEKIRRTTHLPEEDRMRMLQDQLNHLQIVEQERKFYNAQVAQAKAAAAAAGIAGLGQNVPNSMPDRMHYSFDFAQQVHLPSSPLQPGPIYFLVPRKCGIFGVCAEAIPQQINYLIDEGMSSSKGSNMVISLLHHFLENYGLGEVAMDLHCDNCSGQNKNKFMLWYLAWRVLQGLHSEITVNFMPAGHTKFAPDWCFGLLKKKFRVSEVHCLQDMCHVVETSTLRGINRAQIVGSESGEVHVRVYNWQAYFQGWFRALKGIKSLYHFRFVNDHGGVVFAKKTLDGEETEFQLQNDATITQQRLRNMPPELPPPGLPEARQVYLRQHIRPFVRPGVQDCMCP